LKNFRFSNVAAGIIAAAGTWLFACFIHSNTAIGIAGLLITSQGISLYAGSFTALIKITGLNEYNRKLILYSIICILAGIAMGIHSNLGHDKPVMPLFLTSTAFLVAAVGITEELVFRGFIQGALSKTSTWFGIVSASGSHAVYKVLVLWSFTVNLEIDFVDLVSYTFAVGLLAGLMRKVSGNIIPSALGHMCFDIMVYGSLAGVPVWVWG
jgi:membrane protease YdiL (CAAX protease family)